MTRMSRILSRIIFPEIEEVKMARKKIRFGCDVSPKFSLLLRKLSLLDGISQGEIFRRAIGLYDIALGHQKRGFKIGSTPREDKLDVTFVF